jgi:hypothetical protein
MRHISNSEKPEKHSTFDQLLLGDWSLNPHLRKSLQQRLEHQRRRRFACVKARTLFYETHNMRNDVLAMEPNRPVRAKRKCTAIEGGKS